MTKLGHWPMSSLLSCDVDPWSIVQARPGVLGIRYFGPFYFRYMVFFGQNLGIKYLVFPEF